MRHARLLLVIVAAALLVTATAAPALGASDRATTIDVAAGVVTIDGQPAVVHVRLVDADGRPVAGVPVRLFVPIEFLGKTKNELVGEAITGTSGKAALRFAPSQTGTLRGTVSFWGAPGFAASDAAITFDVRRAVVAYDPAPVGLQAWWARSWVILVPVLVVWTVYLIVLTFIVRIRRAGMRNDALRPTATI
jgi:hypothetical protein